MSEIQTLSRELYWLVLTLLMTALMWVPYILNRMRELGVLNALWDRYGSTHTDVAWANRMMHAHENAVENLVLFAPLVLLVDSLGLDTSHTALACMLYFYARLVHFIAFTFALPLLRVLTFLLGFAVQMFLLIKLLV